MSGTPLAYASARRTIRATSRATAAILACALLAGCGTGRNQAVDSDGAGRVVASGTGKAGYSGDGGPATAATLNLPAGVAFDSLGNLAIADWANDVIRRVTPSGIITTIAGNGRTGYSGDGSPASTASLSGPFGIA